MKIFTQKEFDTAISKMYNNGEGIQEYDDYGQIVIYTGVYDNETAEETDDSGQVVLYTNFFRWTDDTIRDMIDPMWDENE